MYSTSTMAAVKSSSIVSLLLLCLLVIVLQTRVIECQPQQTCTASLTNLNVCAPFLVPGSPTASTECCMALQSVNHDCMCNTMRIAAQIPSQCNLPPLSCAAN
ncbi:protein 108-like [Solanum dulcamara]|uniref:protein 108-like n=1 Tax=Solanum dulcamara TaxID=45834 RepID=UPI00248668FD|nr:protein 108-like [Solanum dulcamara]